jgi:hypothetical protein
VTAVHEFSGSDDVMFTIYHSWPWRLGNPGLSWRLGGYFGSVLMDVIVLSAKSYARSDVLMMMIWMSNEHVPSKSRTTQMK